MRDIIHQIETWTNEDEYIACATVIQLAGSSPRGVGARMAFTLDGKITGSVSGGCVEGAVIQAGFSVLKTGVPQMVHYGVASEMHWNLVGLACGGEVDVFIQRLDRQDIEEYQARLAAGNTFYTAVIVEGPGELAGEIIHVQADDLDPLGRVIGDGSDTIAAMLSDEHFFTSRLVEITNSRGEVFKLFLERVDPLPQLIMVGGVHIAVGLASIAKTVGYSTTVIDPRKAFGNPERFPTVDRLIQAWPQEAFKQVQVTSNTAIAILTHDPKIDDPALEEALVSPAFYIGALGSRHTQKARYERFLNNGFTPAQLSRIHGPVGLDLGGKSPEEIGLAIIAEIVAVSNGKKLVHDLAEPCAIPRFQAVLV
jgi:xanthine dehydrogenase accessory factor